MELLIVVLIVGILSAMALPMYQKAVLKSRYSALIPLTKAVWEGNEAYYMEHGEYATELEDLTIKGQKKYPDGTRIKLGDEQEYAYVKMSTPLVNNNYIAYQTHSTNYPGETHCEAKTGDTKAEQLCQNLSKQEPIGETVTSGYTTYVIEGAGVGFPYWARSVDCDNAADYGLTCKPVQDANGNVGRQLCINEGGLCRNIYTHEGGSYTTMTCRTNEVGECVSNLKTYNYTADGTMTSELRCSDTNARADGSCAKYSGGYGYTYDKDGHLTAKLNCKTIASDGSGCTEYYGSNMFYTYDENGNLKTARKCKTTLDGKCDGTYYSTDEDADYIYNGDKTLKAKIACASSIGNDGICIPSVSTNMSGNASLFYEYDEKGRLIAQKNCKVVASDNTCDTYYSASESTFNQGYIYDENGRVTAAFKCDPISGGGCTQVGRYDYVYDNEGRILGSRDCRTLNSDGTCKVYWGAGDGPYRYWSLYDENGNQRVQGQCSQTTSTGCSQYYGWVSEYQYDDTGRRVAVRQCQGTDFDVTTGTCPAGTQWNISN